jgi:hypothetical protein
MLLLNGVTDLLEERRRKRFSTTLHKIYAHTNIRGNYLAEATTKLAVTEYDPLPESQKLTVIIEEVAPRPPYWVMYTAKPRHHLHSWRRVHGRQRYANRGGQFQKGRNSRCTISHAHPKNSDIMSDTRSYVAFTIVLYFPIPTPHS